MVFLFLLDKRNDKQQHDSANDRYDEFPYETAFGNVQQAHKPAADEAADNTDNDVPEEAEAATFHDQTGQPASHCSEEKIK